MKMKVGLNCCQKRPTHCRKDRTGEGIGYLVSMTTTDAKCHMEIKKRRIVIVEKTFSKRKDIKRQEALEM